MTRTDCLVDELLQWTTSSRAQERWSYRYDGLGSRMESRRELAEGGAFTGTATIRREVTGPGLLASAGLSERSPWAVGYGRAESEPALEVRHAVFDEANNILARFYHDDGEHAYVRELADGSEQYYLRDAVGSVVALVDDAENVTARFEYDTFGRVTAGPNVDPGVGGDYRFQGMWLDAGVMQDAAVYAVRARVYDADSGRFFTRDPAEGVQTRPETYSPYAFANGNPTLWRDPSGEVVIALVFHVISDAKAKRAEAAAKNAQGAALVHRVHFVQGWYEARIVFETAGLPWAVLMGLSVVEQRIRDWAWTEAGSPNGPQGPEQESLACSLLKGLKAWTSDAQRLASVSNLNRTQFERVLNRLLKTQDCKASSLQRDGGTAR